MLSKKTKYGIKALTFLARQKDNTPVQIAEIAKAEHISLKFLESILLLLRHSGFLGAKKGKGRSEERRVGKECRSRWSPYH